jgi:hypothetical protein
MYGADPWVVMGFDAQLENGERHVAQSFLMHGVILQDQLQELHGIAEKEFMYSGSLDHLIQQVNEAFAFLDLEAKRGFIFKEAIYQPAWFLINRNGDELARESQSFSQNEVIAIQELVRFC